MKENIFILGDSYSTYKGYVPEGYLVYYSDERENDPIVKGVEKTWWKRLVCENELNIVMNDSYSGSTICNTVRENLPVESSFVNRIDKYASEGFFEKNQIDTMLIFGGTNDSWIDSPIGELKFSDITAEDLKCVLPAFCYLVNKVKSLVKKVIVIINTELKDEITEGFITACKKNEVELVKLEKIDKSCGHPTELGMMQICYQVSEKF